MGRLHRFLAAAPDFMLTEDDADPIIEDQISLIADEWETIGDLVQLTD
ncbi:hypothetical protein [Solirhodobacter olei]|nr:hypothetical protein [Solirhodobacter olei]